MRTSILLAIFLTGFCLQLFAQSDSIAAKRPAVYFNILSAGGLLGVKGQGSALSLSLINGIRVKRFAFGAGVGFDSYLDWKTLPVFGSISFDLGRIRENAFYVQFNGGYSKVWQIRNHPWFDYHISWGQMINPVLGYRITAKQYRLSIAMGYKFQQVRYHYNPNPWITGQTESRISVKEDMNRMVVQIGFGFH